MSGIELREKREEICLVCKQLADKLRGDQGRYVSCKGDLEALGDNVRRLLRLAVEKIEIDLWHVQIKPEIEAKLAEPEAVHAREQE